MLFIYHLMVLFWLKILIYSLNHVLLVLLTWIRGVIDIVFVDKCTKVPFL